MEVEIETDYETVEVASVLRAPSKLRTRPECVSLAALKAERTAKARRRAAFLGVRDRAFARAGFPAPKIAIRNGVRVERRGTCVGGAVFNPTVPISPKSYFYR